MCHCNPDKPCHPFNTQEICLFHSIYHPYLIQFFFTIHLSPPFIQFDTFIQKMYKTFILRSKHRTSHRFYCLPFSPLILTFLTNQKAISPPIQITLQIFSTEPNLSKYLLPLATLYLSIKFLRP